MKKLIKSDICGSVNSAQMHCPRLKKSAFMAESKKKRKKKKAETRFAQTWTQNAQTKHSHILQSFSYSNRLNSEHLNFSGMVHRKHTHLTFQRPL